MKSKLDKQSLEIKDPQDQEIASILDDYSDMPIETVESSRKRFLQWDGL